MVRLSKQDWHELMIQYESNYPISAIARTFGISRHSIYSKGWKEGWIVKKKKKRTIFSKITDIFHFYMDRKVE